jgi:hypothetical protein
MTRVKRVLVTLPKIKILQIAENGGGKKIDNHLARTVVRNIRRNGFYSHGTYSKRKILEIHSQWKEL